MSKAENSVIVDKNNIVTSSVETAALSFTFQSQKNKKVRYPEIHIAISFKAEDDKGININHKELIRKYLSSMGWSDCQYIAVRHLDNRENPHCHIVVNIVKRNGERANDSFCVCKSNMACRRISNSMHSSRSKNENIAITSTIDIAISEASSLRELRDILNMELVGMRIKANEIDFFDYSNPKNKKSRNKTEIIEALKIRRVSDLDILGRADSCIHSTSHQFN